jgi:hypothetical protein
MAKFKKGKEDNRRRFIGCPTQKKSYDHGRSL